MPGRNMHVRDAKEGDSAALATLADVPAAVMRSHLHERTVRVAVSSDADGVAVVTDSDGDPIELTQASERPAVETDDGTTGHANAIDVTGGSDDPTIAGFLCGFVSFDAGTDTIFVTQLRGSPAACHRLLEDPTTFAERESMAVEAVVPGYHETVIDALVATGFDETGPGPRFEGDETRQFRLERTRGSRRNTSG